MALSHCLKSEMDLFATRPTQLSILDSAVVAYYPVNASLEKFIEFHIPRSSDVYRDLGSIYLKLDVSIQNLVKKENAASTTCSVVNNLLHSLFESISVSLNGVNITPNSGNYNYRAYIETLLNYSRLNADTSLTSSLFHLDVNAAGKGDFSNTDTNLGFKARREAIGTHGCELYGRLHLDLSTLNQLMGIGTELLIKFQRATNDFVLCSSSAEDSKAVIKINSATLYLRNVTPTPAVLLAHAKTLAQGGTFRYNFSRTEVRTSTIPSNESSVNLSNFLIGTIPKLLIIGFVENDSFSGVLAKNGLEFKHFNYTSMSLRVNGVAIPPDNYTPDFDQLKFTQPYHSLMSETHIKSSNLTHMITPQMYASGYHLVAWDLTPDGSGTDFHASMPRQGNIGLDIRFAKPLPTAVTVVIYTCYDSSLEQLASGEIITTEL